MRAILSVAYFYLLVGGVYSLAIQQTAAPLLASNATCHILPTSNATCYILPTINATSPTSNITCRTRNATSAFVLSSPLCTDIKGCRTIPAIVWSSAATALACAWFAIHRNVPYPGQWWVFARIEVVLVFVIALALPEWALAWSVRQWFMSRKLLGELEKNWKKMLEEIGGEKADGDLLVTTSGLAWPRPKGGRPYETKWTRAHAFFIISGGFFYYDHNGKPLYPLSSEDVLEHVRKGELVPPAESEISDRSKGSSVSKLLAVLQTVYFVMQCIARLADHHAVTNIEVMALAYTIITIPMYCFWWSKPLNVTCPIRVPMKPTPNTLRNKPHDGRWPERWLDLVIPSHKLWKHQVAFFLGTYDELVSLRGDERVPTFYSGNPEEEIVGLGDFVAMSYAILFGAVHGIAFWSPFITEAEKALWGIGTAIVLGFPIIGLAALAVYFYILANWPGLRRFIVVLFGLPGLFLYLLARGLLFFLALIELRSLPCSAFETVQWLGFIPHV